MTLRPAIEREWLVADIVHLPFDDELAADEVAKRDDQRSALASSAPRIRVRRELRISVDRDRA